MKTRFAYIAIFLSVGLAFASDGFAQGSNETDSPVVQSQETPLSNADIVKLTKLKLGDEVIIAKINQAKAVNFNLGTDALIKLKKNGVSKEVISAMLKIATPQNHASSDTVATSLNSASSSSNENPQTKAESDTPQKTESPSSCQAKVVTDSKKVVAGEGCKIKGIDDWEGEISGEPAPGSKFTQLKIGMGMRQVMDTAGQPTDQTSYVTGKAFIPFYHGSDKHRMEYIYKNQGRLIFDSSPNFGPSDYYLVWIIHNSNEPAYR